MKRRSLVALVSACVLLLIAILVVSAGFVATRTRYGQEQVRKLIEQQIASRIHGKFYLGAISGGFLSGITIDSVAIRDENDSLFLSTGRIHATYDPRDLIDKRIYLRTLDVDHPVIHLAQDENGKWLHDRIFRSQGPKGPKAPGRAFGDFIVADSATVHNGRLTLTLPWHPDDTLHGAKLDSAIRYNIAHREVTAYRQGNKTLYYHDYHWRELTAFLPHVRLADPDSSKFGRVFEVGSLAVAEHDPPFRFSNLRGSVRNLGDSIWVNFTHFDLPASTGTAQGKIMWGSHLPIRYDIRVHGDSVSLADVNWVYPTLPTTGGGTTELRIANDPKNLRVIEYKLSKLDMRTTKSHITGDITFAVGHPVLVVKDVNLVADPMDFDFLRTLSSTPWKTDFRGPVSGFVRARGGPLNRFVVDASDMTWRDTHVPGAVSRLSGKGELDILFPAFTNFHGFDVDVKSLDLRSVEYLFTSFPKLGGFAAGTARLDSSWLDVRFSNANVTLQDGPGDPTRFTGNGRVTWGEQFMTYDVDLQAQPLSLTMLARSYPSMALQGLFSGPIKARGTVADLAVNASLSGDAGRLTYDGALDVYPPGFAARGKGEFAGLDLAKVVSKPNTMTTSLNGTFDADVIGDSLANLRGGAALALVRSDVNGVRIFPSHGRLSFSDGRMRIDTLEMESTAASVRASGSLGLARGSEDSIRFEVNVDSLGGLRRYLARAAVPEEELATPDSLSGNIVITGMAKGRLDSLDVKGQVNGAGLYVRGDSIALASGSFDIRDALRSPNGNLTMRLAALSLLGVQVDTVIADFGIAGRTRSTFRLTGQSAKGPNALIAGSIAPVGTAQLLRLDTVTIAVAPDRTWRLVSPAQILMDSSGTVVDSLVLANGEGGRADVRGSIPNTRPVTLSLRVDSLPLGDLAAVAQVKTALQGYASLSGQITGTRQRPEIRLTSVGHNLQVGSITLERMQADGAYRDRRFDLGLDVFHHGAAAVHATASLPMQIRLFGADVLRGDSLRASVVADSADLGLVEAFLPTLQKGSGRISAHLTVAGTYGHPAIGGQVAVRNGQMFVQPLGITLGGIDGGVELVPGRDSAVVRLRASSGAASDAVVVNGWIANLDESDKRFDIRLGARNFQAINRRTLAQLDVSTNDSLRLSGSMNRATLSGSVRIPRGQVFLPDREQQRKRLVDAGFLDAQSLAESAEPRGIAVVPDAPSTLLANLRLQNVRIDLGDEVYLKSNEADVKLSGSLNVRSAPDLLASKRGRYRLALEGQINADRGRYSLDLGPAVRREFDVQSGTIKFEGTADNNPLVDITALYNVKRPQQSDLGVIVHLHGPLSPYPVLDFSSTESYEISQSDLVSYLVTGQPAFQLQGDAKQNLNTAAAVLAPTASTYLASKLRQSVGGFVDAIQVEGVATNVYDGTTGTRTPYENLLSTVRIAGEKQVRNNLFVSLSAGLCPLAPTVGAAEQQSFLNTVGMKLEYRFDPTLSLQAGLEPSSSARTCQDNIRGLAPTPRQWGLSLFHSWRF